jgi:hypothetical protein
MTVTSCVWWCGIQRFGCVDQLKTNTERHTERHTLQRHSHIYIRIHIHIHIHIKTDTHQSLCCHVLQYLDGAAGTVDGLHVQGGVQL